MPVLHFKGKTAVESYHHTVPHHTLEFDRKLSCLEKEEAPSLEGNLIIEGDNLLALKALLPTHAGRIKCIYIDPPYNTGNEGWIYNDNLTSPQFKDWIGKTVGKEGEDACRHDKWCCMMYPRLQLLKELLREDGVIFVSIDDNQVHHLRMLMNEIFGEENFIATIVWRKKFSPDARQDIDPTHDYVVVYARSSAKLAEQGTFGTLPLSDKRKETFKNPDNDPRGRWASVDMTGMTARATKEQFFSVSLPSGRVISPPPGRSWGLAKATFEKLCLDGRIWFGKGGDGVPRVKRYLSEVTGRNCATWWTNDESGTTESARKTLLSIMGKPDVFDFPKPLELIQRIVSLINDPSAIILDSFAGSGTTAHAVLQTNVEDGGDRRFILVQIPHDSKKHQQEKLNICRKITAKRIRCVIRGYTRSNGNGKKEQIPGLGGSFTYARLSDNPLFGEYKDFGDALPSYEDIAKYVFYTETSHEFPGTTKKKNPAWDKKIGRIGQHAGRSYYLLYQPNHKLDCGLDADFLSTVALHDPHPELIVYCEKIWLHRDQLRAFEQENHKRIRPMLVPFNLK